MPDLNFVLNILFFHIGMKCDRVFIIMFYRQKLNKEYSQQFLTLFQQWEIDMKKVEEQEEKLSVRITFSFIINLLRPSFK
jgi:hypothetical protein